MYQVNEIFLTLQGEGMRAGEASVFVRFSGCNLACTVEPGERSPGGFDCDTEFTSGRKLTANQLLEWVKQEAGACRWIVATGGEPGLQLDAGLIDLFHVAGFRVAVETNGSIDLEGRGIDWITVSPKVAEHAVRQLNANEVKYIRAYGQGIPNPKCQAVHQLISPAFNGLTTDRRTLEWCRKLVEENPDWRLSVQQHKGWAIR